MYCLICNKNLATIHIQEIVNGTKNTIHICQDCAEAKGLDIPLNGDNDFENFLNNVSVANAKILQEHLTDENETVNKVTTCLKCGWDGKKMKRTGRLGCAECYSAFKDKLKPSLTAMHRGVVHCGKIPVHAANNQNISILNILRLEKKLELLVKNEEYEEAAIVRDKLKNLKAEQNEEQ